MEVGGLPSHLEREVGHFLGVSCPILEALTCAQELGRKSRHPWDFTTSTQLSGPSLCFEKLRETRAPWPGLPPLLPTAEQSGVSDWLPVVCLKGSPEEPRERKWLRAASL